MKHLQIAPYIGVTGVASVIDVKIAVSAYTRIVREAGVTTAADAARAGLPALPNAAPMLMLGILASDRSLRYERNRNYRRYPTPQVMRTMLPGPFVDDAGAFDNVLPILHYAPGDPTPLEDEIQRCRRAWETAPWACAGMQINAHWPDREMVAAICSFARMLRVVLQVGPRMMQGAFESPGDRAYLAAEISRRYGSYVSDVLLDVSGGEGRAIGLEQASAIDDLIVRLRDLGVPSIGVAGGLGPGRLTAPIRRWLWQSVSIDAETHLRDDSEHGGGLVPSLVEDYLREALVAARTAP